MRRLLSTRGLALLLVFVAIAGAPSIAATEKKAATGPLEVTYYFLPG
jgi:hypothetical protein